MRIARQRGLDTQFPTSPDDPEANRREFDCHGYIIECFGKFQSFIWNNLARVLGDQTGKTLLNLRNELFSVLAVDKFVQSSKGHLINPTNDRTENVQKGVTEPPL